MKNSSKISIIIPVFNAENYLKRCLKSIVNQTYKHFEVLIIDDGSTDTSKEIYSEFVNRDNRFKAFYQPNMGPSSARNLGIEKSTSNYIAFIDADDYVAINYIENLISAALTNNADLVCGGYYELSKYNLNPLPVNDFKIYINTTININNFVPAIFEGTAGVLWGKLFKSDIIIKNNLKLHPEVKMSEDLIFVLEYVFYATTIIVVNTNGYYYNRLNEESLSSKQAPNYLNFLKLTNEAIETILAKNKYQLVNIDNLKKRRIWSLLKLLTYNIANSKGEILGKTKKIKSLLDNQYIKKYLLLLNEQQAIYKLHLFFLKQEFIFLDVLYCILLKNIINFKQTFKKK